MAHVAELLHEWIVRSVVGTVDRWMFAADPGDGGVRGAERHGRDGLLRSSPQSRVFTSVLTTNWMITEPPGDPTTIRMSPRPPSGVRSKTSVGAIELRGRLPGSTRLATGSPSSSTGSAEKSVSWLLRRKPSVMWNEPKADSMVVVMDATLP